MVPGPDPSPEPGIPPLSGEKTAFFHHHLATVPQSPAGHLTLHNWRNFKEADFDLQDRMLVVGPNASGKSNLLDALRFLREIASPGGGFQRAVESRGGLARVRCLAARNHNRGRATMGIAIGDDQRPRQWFYEVTFTREPRGQHRPVVFSERVERNGEVVLRRPDDDDRDDPERMTQTHLEQVNTNREFREIAEFVRSIGYLHLVPQLLRNPERADNGRDDPYGASCYGSPSPRTRLAAGADPDFAC